MELLDELEINVINDLFNLNIYKGIDPKKITYDYYRTYDFWKDKFPKGWEYIPGFDNIIQSIHQKNIEKNNSPLREMTIRQIKRENHKILYQSILYEC